MKKRGQMAMEMMSTYGWVIIVVAVAGAAFAYLGLLKPESYIPEICIIAPDVQCVDHAITSDTVALQLKNVKGEDMNVISITVPTCSGVANGTIPKREIGEFWITGCSNTDKKFKSDVLITYRMGDGLNRTKIGKIVGAVG